MRSRERRMYGRVQIDPPLRASLDGTPVNVIDASVTGFRIAHDARIAPLPTRRLRVHWEEQTMEFGVVVARSTLIQFGQGSGERTTYHSGIHILEAAGESEQLLRQFIAGRVIHALEEMKANAHGIPPLSTYTYQVEKGDRFRRCELIGGRWRKMETTDRMQPAEGFTVSAEVDARHVDMLCRLYEQTTEEGKGLTKMLAELSISKEEGTPTRRYVP